MLLEVTLRNITVITTYYIGTYTLYIILYLRPYIHFYYYYYTTRFVESVFSPHDIIYLMAIIINSLIVKNIPISNSNHMQWG